MFQHFCFSLHVFFSFLLVLLVLFHVEKKEAGEKVFTQTNAFGLNQKIDFCFILPPWRFANCNETVTVIILCQRPSLDRRKKHQEIC